MTESDFFLPVRHERDSIASYANAGTARAEMSVCHTLAMAYCIKTNKVTFSSPSESPKTLVFADIRIAPKFEGVTPSETAVVTNWRFSTFTLPYLRNGARYAGIYRKFVLLDL